MSRLSTTADHPRMTYSLGYSEIWAGNFGGLAPENG